MSDLTRSVSGLNMKEFEKKLKEEWKKFPKKSKTTAKTTDFPETPPWKKILRTISSAFKNEGGEVKKKKSGGKVYSNQSKRYAHGGKVSGRKAKYNG